MRSFVIFSFLPSFFLATLACGNTSRTDSEGAAVAAGHASQEPVTRGVGGARRADSLRADSIRADSLRADSLRRDSLRVGAKRNEGRADTAGRAADTLVSAEL